MSRIFRLNPPDSEDITEIGIVEAIGPAIRSEEPGRYHVNEISSDPLPIGHTSRRWGTATKHPDGTFAVEPDPWND